jgi:RND superfamily putative drug exporter
LSIVGTTFVMRALGEITDVSIFAINLASALGLALAIDYSLLIVERYREELRERDRPEAILAAITTAGRTVAFSAATVALALSALAVFPMYFLRSFAYAGVCVVAIAVVGALVVLPAILAAVGPRIDALSFARQRKRVPPGTGRWHTIATVVMRRPVPIAIASVGVLAVLAVPFAGAKLVFPDDRNLPASSAAAKASDEIRAYRQTPNTPAPGDRACRQNAYVLHTPKFHSIFQVPSAREPSRRYQFCKRCIYGYGGFDPKRFPAKT